ncbi:CARDB domain-containing protein [Melittangium boletus]|uniref:CARDB domain-containing protein n=1 Tax=Melittangium boletus TaxID=83453 RepID=UPI003DA472D7
MLLFTSACTPAVDTAPPGAVHTERRALASVLSTGKSASASSSNAPYTPNNLTDGNANSYWESANGAFPQWAQVDLGTAALVEDIVLRLPAGWGTRQQTLTVQSSTDGAAFTTLKASAVYTFDPSTGNAVTIDVPDTSARYVRVTLTANTGWGAGQLSEFEVRGTASTPPTEPPTTPPSGTNLAQGKPIVGSSTEWQYVASNANDGRTDTYWEGAGGQYPSHLTVSLGASVDLSGVVVKVSPASDWATRTQTFEVQGRGASGGSWATLKASAAYTFNPATGNTVTVPLSATAAEVRLVFTANTGSGNGQVAEFQVYGAPTANPDLTVTAVTSTPSAPVETDAITLSATVKNIGTRSSATTSVDLTLDGVAVASASVSGLAAGATTTVSASIGKRGAGAYTLGAVVDPQNTVVEQNEGNNAYSNPTRLTVSEAPGPDLQVLSISPTPANPAVGAAVKFSVAVKNRGSTAVNGATVTRVVVGGSTLDTSTAAIAAGATLTVTTSGSWTATSGGATVTATADATNLVTETNETNNTFSQAIVVGRGAAVPWVSYEAEAGRYQGTLLETDALRTFGHTNFATESSGRKAVRLNSTGQYVEFTALQPANAIVVRNAIPDAPGGGGQEATISLYANGTFVRKLTLSSRHSWLYGNTDGPEALTNTPQTDARRLFDEAQALLAQTYPAGTVFRLQRDANDTAAFYIIDLIDLEQVAPPTSKPAECTSITNYGAVPNDGLDDTDALQRAVMDDQNGVIACVWIPAGQWRQEKKILTPDPLHRGMFNQVGIRDVSIRGAGMWHSQLYSTIQPHLQTASINHPHEGNFGFDIDDNVQISDIAIFGSGRIRGGDGNAEGGVALNGRFGKNSKITNVWIEHANVAVWVGRDYDNIPDLWNPADGLQFSGMRIRDTYADGINFSNGTRNSRVFNSSFRTTGDDALAVWANPYVKDRSVDIAHDNHFINNTVQLPWRANGIAIYGGYGNTIQNNLVYDTMNYPGIMLATDHDPLPFSGTTLIANNGLYRTGGAFWNEDQEFGAITLFPSTRDIVGVTIRDTDIDDSTYDGIQFKNGGGNMPNVVISNVRISNSRNGAGILAMSGARGNATLTNVTISTSADGNITKEPGSTFVITGN